MADTGVALPSHQETGPLPDTRGCATHPAQPAYDAIVIGGSSGAIDALGVILPALPATLHACVLVVMHLPRDRRSLLADIFRQRCALPLQEAQDKDAIAPGTVYFAPPDYHLLVDAGPSLASSFNKPPGNR